MEPPAAEIVAPPPPPVAPPAPFGARLGMTFWSPGRLGEALGRNPTWWDALILACLAALLGGLVVVVIPRGRETLRRSVEEQMRASGQPIPEESMKIASTVSLVAMPVGAPFGMAVSTILSAFVFWILFSVLMGSGARFVHHLALAAHIGLISAVGMALQYALIVSSGSLYASMSAAALVNDLRPNEPLFILLASLNPFTFWTIGAASAGEAAMGKISFAGAFLALAAIYAALVGGYAGIMAAVGSLVAVHVQ